MTSVLSASSPRRNVSARRAVDIEIYRYRSLIDLKTRLHHLDELASDRPLTLVLVLDDRFTGHLPSLIQRQSLGFRLVLTAATRLPGLLTIGDLAACSGALGWQQIVFHRDASEAVPSALDTVEPGERFVLCWPAWHDEQTAWELVK